MPEDRFKKVHQQENRRRWAPTYTSNQEADAILSDGKAKLLVMEQNIRQARGLGAEIDATAEFFFENARKNQAYVNKGWIVSKAILARALGRKQSHESKVRTARRKHNTSKWVANLESFNSMCENRPLKPPGRNP